MKQTGLVMECEVPSARLVNPFDRLLGYQLRRASVAMMGDLAARMAKLDLRVAEMFILLVIEANPYVSQSDIGRMLGIQRANMAPLANALTERGLVVRTPGRGRVQALALTPQGHTLARKCWKQIEVNEQRMLPELDLAGRRRMIDWLRGIWEDDPQM